VVVRWAKTRHFQPISTPYTGQIRGRDVARTTFPGTDESYGEAGADILDTRDGVNGNDLANGGRGRDRCTTDPGDRRVSCP
jgi:hypothetical protein